MNDMHDLWKRCGDTLREQVSDATWRTWLAALSPEAFDGDLLVLSAPSLPRVRERVENRYIGLIAAAATEVASREVKVRLGREPHGRRRPSGTHPPLFDDDPIPPIPRAPWPPVTAARAGPEAAGRRLPRTATWVASTSATPSTPS